MQTPLWPTTQQRHRAFHHPNRSLVPLPVKGRYGTLYTYTDQCTSQKQGHTLTQACKKDILPKSKDILLHKRGKTVKTWTSTMLTIVWSNLQTWLISPIFSLSFYGKRTHFCTGCSQESHTTHTWTITLVYSKVGTAAFTGLSHPCRPDCVGCPQLGFACQFLKVYNPRSECAPPRVSCQEARCQLVPTLG